MAKLSISSPSRNLVHPSGSGRAPGERVYRRGVHIPNSPFKIYVGETEIGNASHVKVYGKGLSEGMANEINEFVVNTKDAGES